MTQSLAQQTNPRAGEPQPPRRGLELVFGENPGPFRVIPAPEPRARVVTSREAEVLELLADGMSNADIAERLVLSEATVKTHVRSLMSKLGRRSRLELVVIAFRSGFVPVDAASVRCCCTHGH